MEKIIYFGNNGRQSDCCSGKAYKKFIDYAFLRSDYFMLVFVDYYSEGYSSQKKRFEKALEPYKVKSRTNPSWPGTPKTITCNTTYKVNFYKTDERAKEILKEMNCLSDWSRPSNPEDLAFFIKNECWFFSVGHEKIGAIICPNNTDFEFFKKNNLSYQCSIFKRDEVKNFIEIID